MSTDIHPDDAGCWIASDWGQYGPARLVEIAADYGYPNIEAHRLAGYKLLQLAHPGMDLGLTPEHEEYIVEASEEAERWLNDNAAPGGYQFGWYDGEFMLWDTLAWIDVLA